MPLSVDIKARNCPHPGSLSFCSTNGFGATLCGPTHSEQRGLCVLPYAVYCREPAGGKGIRIRTLDDVNWNQLGLCHFSSMLFTDILL